MSLEGRVALVTGAGGDGMGRSISLTLARDGADVVLNYRTSQARMRGDPAGSGGVAIRRSGRERAEAAAEAVRAMGRRAIAAQADVTDAADVERLVAAGVEAFGRIDIAVCSAGAPWTPRDVTEITPEHLRKVVATEIESVYHLLRTVLPGMRERRWGRVVLIGGHMADDWRFGPPEAPLDYPMGKAARHWIARTLGPRELPHGVTVNAVAPGPTRRFSLEQAVAALRDRQPSEDGNTPQDIAEAVAFLCSDAAARISGAVIPVPGSRPV